MRTVHLLSLRGVGSVHHRSLTFHQNVTRSCMFVRPSCDVTLRSGNLRTKAFKEDPETFWEHLMKSGLVLVDMSPLDEEYSIEVKELIPYFSKYGFFLYRLTVQVKKLIKLSISEAEIPKISPPAHDFLRRVIDFRASNIHEAENIPHVTNPDERAVLKFLKEKCKSQHEISKVLQNYNVTCNQGLFSTAFSMMVRDAFYSVLLPVMTDVSETLSTIAKDNTKAVPPEPTSETEISCYLDKLGKLKKLASLGDRLSKLPQVAWNMRRMLRFTDDKESYNAPGYCELDWEHVLEEYTTSQGFEYGRFSAGYNDRLYRLMVEFHDILDSIIPMVVDGGELETKIKSFSKRKMLEITQKRNFEMALPPALGMGWWILAHPFNHQDMVGVVSYSFIRCKVILQVLKNL